MDGNSETASASVGENSLRRRREDEENDAARDGASSGGGGDAPALKKPKLDSDDDAGATDSSGDDGPAISSESTGGNAEGEEEEEDEDEDEDDMDLASTQTATLLPDDDTEEDTAMDDDDLVEVPSTPPPVQLTAAALARQALASSALRIDPSAKSMTSIAARPSIPNNTLVVRHKFPLLTDKVRMVSPEAIDADGQPWRIVWLPHGHNLNDEFVGVFVEMVVDEPTARDGSTANGRATIVRDRHAVMVISLLHPRDPTKREHTKKSGVTVFEKENSEFGVESFVQRARILNPSDSLLNAEGDVELEVRLHFVANTVASEIVDLDVEVDPSVSPVDEDDLLGMTPLVTPTAAALTVGTPTTTTHHELMMYDSKKETGMVGLKNQGATCYMNSLLQTLFHLLAFRHVVYETPTEQEDTNDSVSLALQRVFYRLQTQTKAVSTKELTRSFGWSQIDAFMQHDVQELYRILCDRLEEKMKNTKVDNAIKKLFEGKVRSFVQCVNVDFQSFRDESFYDLQLDVKGCKDIYESFRKYVEIEMLEGDNQYEAEGHGKQDAKKGVKFVQFPPVLNIQLKRFEYDPMRDGMVKIHDRFEYPTTLVLDEFAPKQSSGKGTNKLVYHLHSVLVHSGDVHGGHYYVFIRPGKNIAKSDEWFRFDDDQITRVDEQTAVEGNYGSVSPANTGSNSGPTTPLYSSILSPETTPREAPDNGLNFKPLSDGVSGGTNGETDDVVFSGETTTASNNSLMLSMGRSFASAYMLVYVRDGENDVRTIQDDAEGTVSVPNGVDSIESEANGVSAEDPDRYAEDVKIPEPLIQRFHEEEKASARRKKAQQTEHLFMTFRIASDTSITKLKKITKTMDFSSFGNNGGLRIRIKRAATIQQLYTRIYKRTGVPVAQQRLWKVITRENRTHRPDTPLRTEMLNYRVDALIDDDASAKAPVRLYLQVVDAITDSPNETPIFRHFWTEFNPPEDEKSNEAASTEAGATENAPEEDEDELLDDGPITTESELALVPAPNVAPSEIMLFIKFYDLKKTLGERLEYMGNILFDSRRSGAQLAKYLYAALNIPTSTELILYEEIQPSAVSEIDMEASLEAGEIQHGDIICYQFADDERKARQLGGDDEQTEKYPDVPSYFQYLLDRVDVLLYKYRHPQEEPLAVHLLFSNCYDEIIDAVARQLGFDEDKKLYLRLYQHSPLNQLPKKNPLRHARYAGDRQTTLEDFLTEYSERTTSMYYEILANPITEIESKKQVVVYFSIYDDCFVDSSAPAVSRRLECLVSPSDSLSDLLKQVCEVFELESHTKLRACEVSHNGTLVMSILEADAPLEKFWTAATSTGYTTVNDVALFVERIPEDEVAAIAAMKGEPTVEEEEAENRLFHLGVVHFNFQMSGQHWIHPHSVPLVMYFREQDTISQVKERIRQRIGVSDEIFAKWELAVVKDIKASSMPDLYQDMEPEVIESFTMAKLEDVCGAQFENITSLGLEHADTKASAPKYARRQEQGIKIRQS